MNNGNYAHRHDDYKEPFDEETKGDWRLFYLLTFNLYLYIYLGFEIFGQ